MTPQTQAVLVNSLYFTAPWARPFSPYSTSRQDFFTPDGATVAVDMMAVEGHFSYGRMEGVGEVVEMVYDTCQGCDTRLGDVGHCDDDYSRRWS